MRRFKIKDSSKLQEILNERKNMLKKVDDNGELLFSWKEVYVLAKATGLKSKKKRKIIKRFRLLMHEAIEELVNSYK